MPKVPERKLSLGEELNKLRKVRSSAVFHGTKDFSTHFVQEARSSSRHGAVKTTRPPAAVAKKDYAGYWQHIRSIAQEDQWPNIAK